MTTEVQSTRLSLTRDPSTPHRSEARFSRTPDRYHLHPQLSPKCRSPADFKREPSPFELGDSVDLNVASQYAIIDKAAIMDISGGICRNVDEYIQLFMTEYCVIDRACFEDVSTPNVKIVVVEEDDDQEKARTGVSYAAPKPLPILEEDESKVDSEDKKKLRLRFLLIPKLMAKNHRKLKRKKSIKLKRKKK